MSLLECRWARLNKADAGAVAGALTLAIGVVACVEIYSLCIPGVRKCAIIVFEVAKSQCRSPSRSPCFAADRECDPGVCRNC